MEIKKYDNKNYTIILEYNEFYSISIKYVEKFIKNIEILGKEICDYTDLYVINSQKKYSDNLNEFNKIISFLNDEKLKLENLKHNYFESCKNHIEQEQNLINIINSKNPNIENVKANKEILLKLKNLRENNEINYKLKIVNFNENLIKNEEKYDSIYNNFKKEESIRINFIQNIFNKFTQFILFQNNEIKDYFSNLNLILNKINPKIDLKTYENCFNNKLNNEKRFTLEKFLDYQNKENSQNKNLININGPILDEEIIQKLGFDSKNNLINNFEIIQFRKNIENTKKDNSKLENIIKNIIYSENKITEDELSFIITNLVSNYENSKLFINSLIFYYEKDSFVKIKNKVNFNNLLSILLIIINNVKDKKDNYEINYILIYIIERTIYLNSDDLYNKNYLSKNLGKNNSFKNKKFWLNLIENKISNTAELRVKAEIEKKDRNKIQENSSMLFKVVNIFNNKKIEENKKVENEILFGQIYQKNLPFYVIEVLDEFIQHFYNFDYNENEIIEIINELNKKYKFDNLYLDYYTTKININKYRLNKKSQIDFIHKKDINIDYNKIYFNNNTKYKKIKDKSIKSILYSLKYLNFEEYKNILLINKDYNKIFKRIIYKNILIKYNNKIDLKTHIKIWKILLDYNKFKKEYNYKQILEKIMKNEIEIISINVIKNDVIRTPFDINKNENQNKIFNILQALSYINNSLNYCQGMNMIAAFLLNINNYDEEETFYLFLSILNSTEYSILFNNDLDKLKKYFYIYERILNILLPDVYFYLYNNNIKSSFFLSPWFITLFTNVYNLSLDKNEPKIILRIWDMFIFSGWKAILKIGIALIKLNEKKLFNFSLEDLLRFLISDILKSDLFKNDMLDLVMYISINFKLETNLINNLEKEYEIFNKLPKLSNN